MFSAREWLRPPRSILLLYIGGAATALLCVTGLALRQLAQEGVVEAQRAQFRLEAIADRVVARSQQAISDIAQ